MSKSARLFKGVFYATVVTYVIDYALGFGAILIILFGTYAVAKSRARVGKVYGIAVNPFANWCLSFWCGFCVVSQVCSTLRVDTRGRCGLRFFFARDIVLHALVAVYLCICTTTHEKS